MGAAACFSASSDSLTTLFLNLFALEGRGELSTVQRKKVRSEDRIDQKGIDIIKDTKNFLPGDSGWATLS